MIDGSGGSRWDFLGGGDSVEPPFFGQSFWKLDKEEKASFTRLDF